MAKKKHVIHGCKARLRPKIAGIKKRIQQGVASEINYLKNRVESKDVELNQLSERFAASIRNIDKGRTLKSHLSGWWRHRNA